jgi:hypothetical protein
MKSGSSPAAEPGFAVCVCNDGFPAALELHKLYRMLPDAQGARHGLVRIVDESGEGYLYPEEYFQPVDLSLAATEGLLRAS